MALSKLSRSLLRRSLPRNAMTGLWTAYHGEPGHPLEEACRTWKLSSSQVQAFFHSADAYEDRPYQRFYQMGCSISGHLQAEGRNWRFAINGGGVATWQEGGTTRHFGCSAKKCESLLLLPTDGMGPE
ncbi:hypothetical protein QFW77_11205 [Luteimonas sp. RD2P54]|uniref:Uncharacterized protein n=1 Tax=Luteimonas endophytica TaxID=3042023 RepID=A0ABT6JBJ8_9GAMM|nr:hypothetical protein [Luteimonas endophytica]MDH5823553.1 hypothetical protein [Luteimonas endophytica]